MINSIPNYKTWLTPITSLWQPKSDTLSLKKSQVDLSATLEKLNGAIEENTKAIAKLTKYLEDKGL